MPSATSPRTARGVELLAAFGTVISGPVYGTLTGPWQFYPNLHEAGQSDSRNTNNILPKSKACRKIKETEKYRFFLQGWGCQGLVSGIPVASSSATGPVVSTTVQDQPRLNKCESAGVEVQLPNSDSHSKWNIVVFIDSYVDERNEVGQNADISGTSSSIQTSAALGTGFYHEAGRCHFVCVAGTLPTLASIPVTLGSRPLLDQTTCCRRPA